VTEDPERLLSEALRAQAARAPRSEPPPEPALFSGSDLISGTDLHHRPVEPTARLAPEPTPALWVVVIALLLGLATGAVVGLLTLI
jgi:hypothetical protein